MSMTIIGTIKSGGVYDVQGKDGTKSMISFVMVDGMGNSFPCQMWPDDPQFGTLSQVIEQYRRHQVQLSVVGYTVRMRTFKDKHVAPWVNFVVSDVGQPANTSLLAATFAGTVKAGAVNRPSDTSKKPFIWFTAVDTVGTAYACQVWSDDPQFSVLAPVFDAGVRRQPVQFAVSYYSLRERTLDNGTKNPQINFVVSDVVFPALQG